MEIYYGALVDSLSKQLKQQGFKFDKKIMADFQKKANAILILSFDNILVENARKKANMRLTKKIATHLKKYNNVKQ